MDYFGKMLFNIPVGVPFADADGQETIDAPDRSAMLQLFGMHPDWARLSGGMVPAYFQVVHDPNNNGHRGYLAVFRRGSNALFCYIDCFDDEAETVNWDDLYES